MEKHYNDLLERYADLIFVVDYLNENVKKLEELKNYLENNYTKQNELTEKKTSEFITLTESSSKTMKKLLNSAAEQVSIQEGLLQKTKEASAKLDNQANQVKQISKDLQNSHATNSEFIDKLNLVYNYIISGQANEKHKVVKSKLLPLEEMDHDTVFTGKEIYDKYYKKIDGPLLIKATDWNGDYCFCVENIVNTRGVPTHFVGRRFYNGRLNRTDSKSTMDREYRIYDNESLDEIIDFYEQLEE